MMARVHPTAFVDPAAELGPDVEVGPHCCVGPKVTIGRGTRLLPGTVVLGPASLGEENVIGPLASLGSEPQDLKYRGEETWLRVGDRNRIREFATLNRGTVGGGGVTTLGNDNLLMAYAHVAHDCHVGSRTVFANAGTLAGHSRVGDWAIVGAFSAVHQNCEVGEHAFIGGFSVLTRDVLPFLRVVGQRDEARTIGVNSVGLARRGFSEEQVRTLKRAYRILRRKGHLRDLLEEVERSFPGSAEAMRLVAFVRQSRRGVIL